MTHSEAARKRSPINAINNTLKKNFKLYTRHIVPEISRCVAIYVHVSFILPVCVCRLLYILVLENDRCRIKIFYRLRQREGGQENMCYRTFPLEMRVRGEGLIYLSLNRLMKNRSVARSSLLSLWVSTLSLSLYTLSTRLSHSLNRYGFVVPVGGFAASNWLFTKLYELLTPIWMRNLVLPRPTREHSRFKIHIWFLYPYCIRLE